MRKVSTLALLLSLVLGTSFAFTACNGDPSDSLDSSSSSYTPYDPDEGKTPDQLEGEANVGYAERIAEWTKYVEYVAPEQKAALEDSQLTKKDTDKLTSEVSPAVNGLYLVMETEDIYTTVETPEVVDPDTQAILSPATSETLKTATKTTQTVYDAETSAVVMQLESVEYVTSGGKLLDTEKKKSDHVKYAVSVGMVDGLLMVAKTAYKLREPVEPAEGEDPEVVDDTLVANYIEETTISLYDKKGNLLQKDLSEDMLRDAEIVEVSDSEDWKTQQLVSIADTTYMLLDGEIIKTFVRGTEYSVPQYGEDYQCSYFQYGNYGYYVVEAEPEVMQIGDFAMARVPGVSFELINADKQLVWTYETTSYHVAGYSVLSDGDVYLCEYKMLESGATDFAFESAGIKFDVIHSRIDAETGAVTTLEKDFIAQKVYNNVTPEINTLLNNAATAEVLANCKVKDGYMLAQVQKYANGVLDSDTEIAVLDEEMNIVATLPKIIDNQFGYVGFLDKDTMLVNTMTTGSSSFSHSICYTAHMKTGNVELYFSMDDQAYIIDYIAGGFVHNDKVYDYDWNVKYDLSYDNEAYDDIDSRVVGDVVYIEASKWVPVGEDESDWQTTVMIGYFTDAGFTTKMLSTYFDWDSNVNDGDRSKYNYDCYVVRRNDMYSNEVEIYDHLGELIMEVNTTATSQSDSYYDEYDNYNYVTYNVEKDVSVSEIGESGTYLVTVAETWSLSTYDDYPDGAHDKSGTYYQYYILK